MSSEIGLLSEFESPHLEKVGGSEISHTLLFVICLLTLLVVLWCSCGFKLSVQMPSVNPGVGPFWSRRTA